MKRQKPPAGLTLFDGPTSAAESCPKRITTITPLSALFLLNNPFAVARTKAFAVRVRHIAGDDQAKQIDTAFAFALNRQPTEVEQQAVRTFFANAPTNKDALEDLCHALLAANEFTTLE